jgi:hypothetical protein
MEVALAGWWPASKVDEPGRVMNNKLVNALEAGFSQLQPWRVLTEKHKKKIKILCNGCDNLKSSALTFTPLLTTGSFEKTYIFNSRETLSWVA